jgi:hypothetical protein
VISGQANRGVAPEVAAALALRATPGAYAVLLGSGMSRASGVPTGYEVLVDLVRQVAKASSDGEEAEADPLGWFATATGADATYDRVQGALTTSPEERVGILRRYFEPSPDEAEQGLKVPSAGHVALARLVEGGLVRVILTINFDRLIERALDQVGAFYVVTATPEAVAGAMPLHLQDCQVIKLHGDYLDPGMLNTPEELAAYEPAIDRLLDRILDEYGLITIGWSTTYDPALRRAIERATTRRFSSWWVEPGTVNDHAQRLITQRASTLVRATGDSFLVGVADAIETLERLDAPDPITPALAAAAAKRALGQNGDRIRLHDLIKQELAKVHATPQVTRTAFNDAGVEEYGLDVERLDAAAGSLLAAVAIAAYWGDAGSDEWWLPAIQIFAERARQQMAGGSTALINLTRYPGSLLFHLGAIVAVAARRWALLRRLEQISLDTSYNGHPWPAAISLDPGRLLGGYVRGNGAPTGVEPNDDPAGHINVLLKRVCTQHLLLSDLDFDAASERAEYLLETSTYDYVANLKASEERANAYAPTRYAGLRTLQPVDMNFSRTPSVSAAVRALLAQDTAAGPLGTGMFGGSLERFTAAADQFDTQYVEAVQQRRFSRP